MAEVKLCEACGEYCHSGNGHSDVPVDGVKAWVCNPCFFTEQESAETLRDRIRARRRSEAGHGNSAAPTASAS